MKIFDCFMYFDEDLILDVRLNYLDKFVDQFVIVESVYSHNGEKRKPQFDIKKFKQFENKITYLLVDHQEKDFFSIKDTDTLNEIAGKKVMNALKRENYQRNFLINGKMFSTATLIFPVLIFYCFCFRMIPIYAFIFEIFNENYV